MLLGAMLTFGLGREKGRWSPVARAVLLDPGLLSQQRRQALPRPLRSLLPQASLARLALVPVTRGGGATERPPQAAQARQLVQLPLFCPVLSPAPAAHPDAGEDGRQAAAAPPSPEAPLAAQSWAGEEGQPFLPGHPSGHRRSGLPAPHGSAPPAPGHNEALSGRKGRPVPPTPQAIS